MVETKENREEEEKRLNIERMLAELESMKQKKLELIERNNTLKANQQQASLKSEEIKSHVNAAHTAIADNKTKKQENILAEEKD